MVDVYTDIIIDCTRDIVAAYAADPNNAPEWYVNIKSAKMLDPGPLKEGSKIKFSAAFMGKQLEYTYEIVEYSEGFHLVMRTSEGPFPMETSYSWESLEGGKCRMTLRNFGKPAGFSRLATPLIALMMKMANRKDLRSLKKILESRKSN